MRNFHEELKEAVSLHINGELQSAKSLYINLLETDPKNVDCLNNLAIILMEENNLVKAIEHASKAILNNPHNTVFYETFISCILKIKDHGDNILPIILDLFKDNSGVLNNIGWFLIKRGQIDVANDIYDFSLLNFGQSAELLNNKGICLLEKSSFLSALDFFKKSNALKNDRETILNMAVCYEKLGLYLQSTETVVKLTDYTKSERAMVLAARNTYALADNSGALAYLDEAKTLFGLTEPIAWAYLHHIDDLDARLDILNKIITLGGQLARKANTIKIFLENYPRKSDISINVLDDATGLERTCAFLLKSDYTPKLINNRWRFFDFAIEAADTSRAFYEFGVFTGESFRYVHKNFPISFGFDSWNGLPEDWGNEPKGSYSTFGHIPKFENSEMVDGFFESSLPGFFEASRPTAGLINFDADLYSSTITALDACSEIIDEHTILVFDEMFINETWEQDEFKALNEFCEKHSYKYDILAVSLMSKQCCVKLIRM